MTPDRQIQALRSILTATESHKQKVEAANAELVGTLRQLLESAMRAGEIPKPEAVQ